VPVQAGRIRLNRTIPGNPAQMQTHIADLSNNPTPSLLKSLTA
jgi:hypothetical protein